MDFSELLEKYYTECTGLANDKSPSKLCRGEGKEAEYFILKIDLCKSTTFIKNRFPETYLKLAHVFLSTIDHITRDYGADENQAEYAGDSVIAYFPATAVSPEGVLAISYLLRQATFQMRSLDTTLSKFPFKTRIVIHYGTLILANIGPWGNSRLTAIGKELHKVGHLEKEINAGDGLATSEFVKELPFHQKPFLKRFFRLFYKPPNPDLIGYLINWEELEKYISV